MGQQLTRQDESAVEHASSSRVGLSQMALLMFVVVLSRAFFQEIGTLAYIYLPHAWVDAPQGEIPPHGGLWFQSLVGFWAHWDGYWYLSIAQYGYQGRPTATAFFPLYPWLLHLFGATIWAGIALSLFFFASSSLFLFLWAQKEWDVHVAWMAVVVYAFFPTAYYLSAVYTESLYMTWVFLTLYLVQARHYRLAFITTALATLTSIYGLLLAALLFVRIWQREKDFWRAVGYSLGPVVGLGIYMVFLTWRFHDPLIFQSVQSNWGRHFAWPWVTLSQAVHDAWLHHQALWNFPQLFASGPAHGFDINFYDALFMMFSLIMVIIYGRYLPLYLWAYLVPALCVTLFFPSAKQPLMSFPRLIFEDFPILLATAIGLTRQSFWRTGYWVGSLYLGALLTALFATAHWVA
ncbi:hypothetical protein SAMN00768000_1510 [Sulfobacillus thermosulfidooxidans DSM 9293]|uniref:Glycosyltransferase RgtA/B/C/D-like domain-containing protein n=1 Tax=Sulfobacillus thermosulfidooxidans (strain DSM 9293 / VKM B-1269 / AT-1) TaxID=929705 RepID=A0A1W1WD00_SULTA|nr:hypothetical protein [Sulfobacillus thermosulfidooxidans]SMC04191.1 hypothetical protein SAMN00768000_1510 [Sulfobacillus thermosulfidooxidans DSM 9293]